MRSRKESTPDPERVARAAPAVARAPAVDLTPASLTALQGSVGNQAVGRIIARNKGGKGATKDPPKEEAIDLSELEEAVGEDEFPEVLASVGDDKKQIKDLLDTVGEGNVYKLKGLLEDFGYQAPDLKAAFDSTGGDAKRFGVLWRLAGKDADTLTELLGGASPEDLASIAGSLTGKTQLADTRTLIAAGGGDKGRVGAMLSDAGDAGSLLTKLGELETSFGVDRAKLIGYIAKAGGKLSSLEDVASQGGANAKGLMEIAKTPAAVISFLGLAGASAAKLIAAAPRFKREPAGSEAPAQPAPAGMPARWAHFLERHTYKHFVFSAGNIAATQSMWPEGYDVQTVATRLDEALADWKTKDGALPAASVDWTQKDLKAGSFNVTVGIAAGEITQFYPWGSGTTSFSQAEMDALKELFKS